MVSTFHGLEVGKRGLFAQQTALSTTGHNITNANTVGYSRQQVNLVASRPIEMPGISRSTIPGQLGTGVTFDSIKRVRESFLDSQFRNEAQSFGAWKAQSDTLEKIELLFNEPSDQGLRTVIDKFWNAWQDLSREPDNRSAREAVKEQALAMIDAFKYTDKKLEELSNDLTTSIEVLVGEANTYITQIASLNQEIRRIEGLGNNANDLRDQRDVIADKLSQIAHINVSEDGNGMYTVTLANGTELVNGLQPTLIGEGGAGLDQITGGAIQGLTLSRDQHVAEYRAHLEAMLQGLIYGNVDVPIPEGSRLAVDVTYQDAQGNDVQLPAQTPVPQGGITVTVNGINGLHELGWTLQEDADGNAVGGIPFFIPADGTNVSIQNIQLNPDIEKNVNLIASSFRIESNADGNEKIVKGNNGLALAMGQLRDGIFNFSPTQGAAGEGTFDEYFRSVVGGLGVRSAEATRQLSNSKLVLDAIDNRRMSVSGVSLDEEMANLIKFQHAYNASARMITTVDQVLDVLINRMGVVGR